MPLYIGTRPFDLAEKETMKKKLVKTREIVLT